MSECECKPGECEGRTKYLDSACKANKIRSQKKIARMKAAALKAACKCVGKDRQVCVDHPDCRPSYCRVTVEERYAK